LLNSRSHLIEFSSAFRKFQENFCHDSSPSLMSVQWFLNTFSKEIEEVSQIIQSYIHQSTITVGQ